MMWFISGSDVLLTLLWPRVKISQNVDIIAKVYLVHLKVEHCQTLRVVSTFTGQKALSCIVEGGQNYSKNQSKMPLCAHLGQQS